MAHESISISSEQVDERCWPIFSLVAYKLPRPRRSIKNIGCPWFKNLLGEDANICLRDSKGCTLNTIMSQRDVVKEFIGLSFEEKKQALSRICNYAQEVWRISSGANPVGAGLNLIDWLSELKANDESKLFDLSMALLICWQLWNDRNNLIFRNCKVHPTRVSKVAATAGSEY
ncbi:hypothetical protein ACFX2I_034831 [Malus domestica]